MEVKSGYCPKCKRITEHVTVNENDMRDPIENVFEGIFSLGASVVTPLTVTECGSCGTEIGASNLQRLSGGF